MNKCPHCDRGFKTEGARTTHARHCAKNPSPGKGIDAMSIEDRRILVMALRVRGCAYRMIADELKISLGTVHADVEAVLSEVRARLNPESIMGRVTDEIHLLEEMERYARIDYFEARGDLNPNLRSTRLLRWQEVCNMKIRTMQSFGLLPKRADPLEVSADMPDYSRMSRTTLDLKMKETLLRLGEIAQDSDGYITVSGGRKARIVYLDEPLTERAEQVTALPSTPDKPQS